MAERRLEGLLRDLDTPIEPDRRFSLRLREIVAAELTGSTGSSPASDVHEGATSGGTTEVIEVLLAERPQHHDQRRRPRWPWVAGAAASVLVVAGVVSVVAISRDDGDATTVTATVPDAGSVVAGEPAVTAPPVSSLPGAIAPPADEQVTFVDVEPQVLPVEMNPYHVAVNGDDVWVFSLIGLLLHLDAATGEELGRLDVTPSSAIAATEGAVWVADAVSGDVVRVDASTHDVVATVPTGVRLVENTWRDGTAFIESAAGTFSQVGGIASDGQSLWVGDRDGRLLRIDPETNTVVAEFATPVTANVVDVDGAYVMAADNSREVVVHDASTGDVVATHTLEAFAGADLYEGALYVLEGSTGVVTKVDLASGDVTRSDPLGGASVTRSTTFPAGLRASSAGVLVEVNGWTLLDPTTLENLGSLEIDGSEGQMVIGDDDVAWIARHSARTLVRIEPS